MRRIWLHVLIAVLAFTLGHNIASRSPGARDAVATARGARHVTPDGWQRLVADGRFTFCLPLGVRLDNGGMSFETYNRHFTGERFKVSVDHGGGYVHSVTKGRLPPGYESSTVEIDGRSGTLSTYPDGEGGTAVEAYIPDAGRGQQFSMTVRFFAGGDVELAREMFSLVRFAPPGAV